MRELGVISSTNDVSKCRTCDQIFSNFKDMVIHQMVHMEINLPNPSQLCPICDDEQPDLEICCHHILDHFSSDMSEKYKILTWFSQFNDNIDKEKTLREKRSEFLNQVDILEMKELFISLPKDIMHFKCIFCQNYYKPEVIRDHIFDYLKLTLAERQKVSVWFSNFFKTKESQEIKDRYVDLCNPNRVLDRNSTLIQELPNYENMQKINICRYCKVKTGSPDELYKHYVDSHNEPLNYGWNCIICNFKASEDVKLLSHIKTKHITCVFCKKKLPFSHMPKCEKRTTHKCYCKKTSRVNGVNHNQDCPRFTLTPVIEVSCPCCKKYTFTEEKDFDIHITSNQCKPWLTMDYDEEQSENLNFDVNVNALRDYLSEEDRRILDIY